MTNDLLSFTELGSRCEAQPVKHVVHLTDTRICRWIYSWSCVDQYELLVSCAGSLSRWNCASCICLSRPCCRVTLILKVWVTEMSHSNYHQVVIRHRISNSFCLHITKIWLCQRCFPTAEETTKNSIVTIHHSSISSAERGKLLDVFWGIIFDVDINNPLSSLSCFW